MHFTEIRSMDSTETFEFERVYHSGPIGTNAFGPNEGFA